LADGGLDIGRHVIGENLDADLAAAIEPDSGARDPRLLIQPSFVLIASRQQLIFEEFHDLHLSTQMN
jgi:hypothetical protein